MGELVKYLCKAAANPNQETGFGSLPVIAAARKGHLEVIKCLCYHGAQADLIASDGTTAKEVAAQLGDEEVVCLLEQWEQRQVENSKVGFHTIKQRLEGLFQTAPEKVCSTWCRLGHLRAGG